MLIKLIVLLASLTFSASAQVYDLGDTKDAIRQVMGAPQFIYSPVFDRFYSLSEEGFAAAAGATQDVWEFKSSKNAFRMRAAYSFDPLLSRLHPAERLRSLTFTPDRDELVSEMLGQIPISSLICMQGCEVFGKRGGVASFELWVCRRAANPLEGKVIAGSYAGWGTYDTEAVYASCSIAFYGYHPEYADVPIVKIDWKSMRVDYIRVGGEDLRNLNAPGKEGTTWIRLNDWTALNHQ